MKVIKTINKFSSVRNSLINQKIGFIPTMGALHLGHLSLIRKSINDSHITVVSIFLNPTQFDNKNDLNNYPNSLNQDLKKLKTSGVDIVLLPNFSDIFPDDYNFQIHENNLSKKYCGSLRNGHFNGVLTIVMKLFNIVQPNIAYFGMKDFQQLTLIKKMIHAFFIPIEIVACETIREKDGLAMSSRNLNLTANERKLAPLLYKTINSTLSLSEMKRKLINFGFKLDYLEIHGKQLLVTAYLGKVRLIDNVQLKKLDHAA